MTRSTPPTTTHAWAKVWLNGLHDLDPAALDGSPFGIELDELVYGCRLQLTPGASRLVVSLRAFPPPAGPPGFAREGWGKALRAHILAISDPSLFLDPRLKTGVFLGRRTADPVTGVIALAQAVAAASGVPSSRIAYWGASGGGFGALMCAIRSGGLGIGVNSQIDLLKIMAAASTPVLAEIFEPGRTAEEIGLGHRTRTDVNSALEAALGEGLTPRLLVVQNTQDKFHLRRHFRHFCARFGIDPAGGADPSGRLNAMLYKDPAGHGRESLGLAQTIEGGWLATVMGDAVWSRPTAEAPRTTITD